VRTRIAVVLAAAALALAGCMEVEQTGASPKAGKYQGKPDTQPWTNAPTGHESAKWSKGDRASWETQIKDRQLAQHEHKRIYQ